MKNNKSGFTLAEVLICVMIVGLIVLFSINTFKIIRASYTAIAYFELENIRQMAGELIAGKTLTEGNNTPAYIFDRERSRYVITSDDQIFCNTIVNLVNTAGKADCQNFSGTTNEFNNPIINVSESNIGKYNFKTTNGHRYYISNHVAGTANTSNYGYRIIAVDLNGPSGPNISKVSGTKVPDIISFMILDNGEVFPVGAVANNPVINSRTVFYLTSKAKGYYFSDNNITGEKRDPSTVPPECTLGDKKTCNFAVVYIPNQTGLSTFSYRDAYCTTIGNRKPTYNSYCPDPNTFRNINCPPSAENSDTMFDLCLVENIKPMFRYNFN